ncbi:hypothetical protein J6590_028863 [Homalodisca vitripennis]|nr:hypothetical protein J6590_028863 [Homalodisca vitripennis]
MFWLRPGLSSSSRPCTIRRTGRVLLQLTFGSPSRPSTIRRTGRVLLQLTFGSPSRPSTIRRTGRVLLQLTFGSQLLTRSLVTIAKTGSTSCEIESVQRETVMKKRPTEGKAKDTQEKDPFLKGHPGALLVAARSHHFPQTESFIISGAVSTIGLPRVCCCISSADNSLEARFIKLQKLLSTAHDHEHYHGL